MDGPIEGHGRCPACGEPSLRPWRAATPGSGIPAPPGDYGLLRCSRCGSAALTGPGSEAGVGLHEAGAGVPARTGFERPLERVRRITARRRVRLLGRIEPRDRVLDVGAGRGGLLAALAERAGGASGIEPSHGAFAAARSRGVRVENVSIERAEVEPRSQDLVILWHVLEHLDGPAEALRRIHRWMAEEGRLVIAVPNLGSLQARLGGDRWFHQDVPRHRTQFTLEGIDRLLRRSGFAPARIRHSVIDQGALGMWVTLLNRLTAQANVPLRFLKRDLHYSSRAQAGRDALVTVALGLPLALVAVLLEAGAAIARRGGSVVVEARPEGEVALEAGGA